MTIINLDLTYAISEHKPINTGSTGLKPLTVNALRGSTAALESMISELHHRVFHAPPATLTPFSQSMQQAMRNAEPASAEHNINQFLSAQRVRAIHNELLEYPSELIQIHLGFSGGLSFVYLKPDTPRSSLALPKFTFTPPLTPIIAAGININPLLGWHADTFEPVTQPYQPHEVTLSMSSDGRATLHLEPSVQMRHPPAIHTPTSIAWLEQRHFISPHPYPLTGSLGVPIGLFSELRNKTSMITEQAAISTLHAQQGDAFLELPGVEQDAQIARAVLEHLGNTDVGVVTASLPARPALPEDLAQLVKRGQTLELGRLRAYVICEALPDRALNSLAAQFEDATSRDALAYCLTAAYRELQGILERGAPRAGLACYDLGFRTEAIGVKSN